MTFDLDLYLQGHSTLLWLGIQHDSIVWVIMRRQRVSSESRCSSSSFLGFLAATKQLNEWYFRSVCPSVTPFWLCSHHCIIMKLSGVITNDISDVHAKVQGQRWKVNVTEVKTQLSSFRTVSPVWIHRCQQSDAQSLMWDRRGALLFFKVTYQISRSHGTKNRWFGPEFGVSRL